MTKGQTIEYAIQKECQRYSLVDWCEEWDFTIDEFYEFLEAGKRVFDAKRTEAPLVVEDLA